MERRRRVDVAARRADMLRHAWSQHDLTIFIRDDDEARDDRIEPVVRERVVEDNLGAVKVTFTPDEVAALGFQRRKRR
ncbi:Hypothetical protein A7982_00040 [Minicystis rosea]|nr:Hypothetical protein A7982_00040 [Minicystis rosea]